MLGLDFVPHGVEGLVVDSASGAECFTGVYPTAIVQVEDEGRVLDEVVLLVTLDNHLVRAVSLLAAARSNEDVFAFGGQGYMDPDLGGSVLVTPAVEAGEEESGGLDGHEWE